MAKPYKDTDTRIIEAVVRELTNHNKLIKTKQFVAIHEEYDRVQELIKESKRVLLWKDTELGDYNLDRWLHKVAIILPELWD